MLEVLKNQRQIEEARQELHEKGADTSRGWRRMIFSLLYTIRYRRAPELVAINKSWDVAAILRNVEKYYPSKDISIYEMGSYNSEIAVSLWCRGYRNIRASDFNPKGQCINYYVNGIDFHKEDMYAPEIQEESLDVMTSVSVIEHGFDKEKFFNVAKKYLKVGGSIFFSTDYHKEKINIDPDYRLFNLTYMIFSKEEIEDLVNVAKGYGLEPIGDIQWEESTYPIRFLNNNMTFILLGLKKVR